MTGPQWDPPDDDRWSAPRPAGRSALRKPPKRRRWPRVLAAIVLIALVSGITAAYLFYRGLAEGLPKLDGLRDYRPNIVSTVYDRKGRLMGEFFWENQRRVVVPYDKIPKVLIDAVIAVEDEHFFAHKGLDYAGIARAAIQNIKTGEIKQGASTITRQVGRTFLLSREKTWERKLREAILAVRLERNFTKDEILFLYLNQIFFGNGAYGVEAAAYNYFGKTVSQLSLGEAALLAGLPQAPSRYNPFVNREAALDRRRHVLNRMVETGAIDRAQADAARDEGLRLVAPPDVNREIAPYFTEHVRRYLMKKYGADTVLKEGLKIHTTCDLDLQREAEKAVRAGLTELAKRQGYMGPERRVARADWPDYVKGLERRRGDTPITAGVRLTGLVTRADASGATIDVGGAQFTMGSGGVSWVTRIVRKDMPARIGPFGGVDQVVSPGDAVLVRVIDPRAKTCELDQAPHSQGALVSMDVNTREVLAIVGGYSFDDSQFNRAVQAKRQPGSAFKPIVYAAALDLGMTPATRFMDTALVFADGWRPGNYSGSFSGELTMRQALAQSINTVTIRIAQAVTPAYIERFAKRLGIKSLAGSDLSMALGTYEVLPIELMNAYAVFASGGRWADPIYVRRIEDRDGNVIEDNALAPIAESVEPLPGAPDVSGQKSKVELQEGDPAWMLPEDSPQKIEFLKDFNVKMRSLAPPKPKGPDRIDDVPLPDWTRDAKGRIVAKQVLSEQTAYLITSLMQSVITRGTGGRAASLGKTLAGKTGTTNEYVDAWFIGYSPEILTGVWVGNDAGSKPLGPGEAGSRAALPIWIEFMKTALKGRPDLPFATPPGIETAVIDPATGLLANDGQEGAYAEYFKAGTAPTQYAPSPDAPKPDRFFEMDF